jgi:excisionase family DNA binding protein
MRKFITIAETATRMSTTEKAIRQRIFRGQLPVVRFGRRVLIPEDEFERFLEGLPKQGHQQALAAVATMERRGQQ